MIAAETWRRFKPYWRELLLAGLFVAVVHGILSWIAAGASGIVSPDGAFPVLMGEAGRLIPVEATRLATLLTNAGTLAVAALLSLVVGPLLKGGLLFTVIRANRGEPVSPADFWAAGYRYWGRLFGLMLVTALVWVGLALVLLLFLLVPLLGPIIWGLGAGMVAVALMGYAPYLALAEDLGPFEAVGKGFQILSVCLVDLFLTLCLLGLVEVGAAALANVANHAIGLQLPLRQALDIAIGPLTALYLAVRYERNIKPALIPPGGGASFHRNPPTGV